MVLGDTTGESLGLARAHPGENPLPALGVPGGRTETGGRPLRCRVPGTGWRPPNNRRWRGSPSLSNTCPRFFPTKGQGAWASLFPGDKSLGKAPMARLTDVNQDAGLTRAGQGKWGGGPDPGGAPALRGSPRPGRGVRGQRRQPGQCVVSSAKGVSRWEWGQRAPDLREPRRATQSLLPFLT